MSSGTFSAKMIATLAATSCLFLQRAQAYRLPANCDLLGASANTSDEDCRALPYYAQVIFNDSNYTWEKIDVTTEDGYQINMVHLLGDDTGARDPTKSPLLLVHGNLTDGLVWFDKNEPGELSLPLQLVDLGYDVFIANLRGSVGARGHETLDADAEDDVENGAKAYWNFDSSDIANYDIPAMVKAI